MSIRFFSSRFGELEVSEEKIISVPEGIIGFPDYHRYVLLDPSGGTSSFLWLQAVDSPDLAFVITDPLQFVPNYHILASEPALERLGASSKPPPALFVIVTVPADNPDKTSINLLAPLVYFANENVLYQIVLEKADWPIRYYLLPQESSEASKAAETGGME